MLNGAGHRALEADTPQPAGPVTAPEGLPGAPDASPAAPAPAAAQETGAEAGARSHLAPATLAAAAMAVAALAYGVLLRGWLLTHSVLTSDEAVVGLMVRAITAGHPGVFYWGQNYGGLEPYVAVAVTALFGGSGPALNLTAGVLAAVSAVLVGAIAGALTDDRRLALLAAGLAWVWPFAGVWGSTEELGFRQAAVCAGLVVLYCAVRVYRGRAGPFTYSALGLAAGLGWWASPEVAYDLVPAALLLVAGWHRGRRSPARRRAGGAGGWVLSSALVVAGAAVGAAPWIDANVRSGLASLHTGALGSSGLGYGARLAVFFRDVLPIELGVRAVPGGAWAGGGTVGRALFGVALAVVALAAGAEAVAAWRARRLRPGLALVAAVVAFPFLYAVFPNAGYWQDGRYGVYLGTLLAALVVQGVAAGAELLAGRGAHRRGGRMAGGAVLAAVALLAAAGGLTATTATAGGWPAAPRALASGWSDPEWPALQVVARLEADRIGDAFGAYWTAYVLDYLADGKLRISASPEDYDRSPSLLAAVASSAHPAWLFMAPGQRARATAAFDNSEPGPGGWTQAAFESMLRAQHVGFRVLPLGVLDAVVPAHKVALPRRSPGGGGGVG